ncbi:MAG: hypothetical protein ACOCUS_02380 [Polyangiales bacterium]
MRGRPPASSSAAPAACAVATLGWKRPDGSEIREPMTLVAPYADQMTDVELRALWAYLQSVDPHATPE